MFLFLRTWLYFLSAVQGVRGEHGAQGQAHPEAVVGGRASGLGITAADLEEQRRRASGGVRYAGASRVLYRNLLGRNPDLRGDAEDPFLSFVAGARGGSKGPC